MDTPGMVKDQENQGRVATACAEHAHANDYPGKEGLNDKKPYPPLRVRGKAFFDIPIYRTRLKHFPGCAIQRLPP